MKQLIKKVVEGNNLTVEEASRAMDFMLEGGATMAQIAAFLVALRMKGETIEEITGCASMMRQKATHIAPNVEGYIDCVGTGGDLTNTFNISTTAAFVIAGAGVPIAKHGNRAVSSRSGSADLLEALGVNIMTSPETVQRCVEEIGVGFLFARTFNQSMKTVSQVRGELGVRTVFNILGPISNPSGAKRQVVGVFDRNLTEPLANVMRNMGVERGMVMSAENGMDEFSTLGVTYVSEIKDGAITSFTTTPEQFGIRRAEPQDVAGGTAEDNAALTLAILRGEGGPKADIVALNAGAAIYCAGKADSIADGVEQARESVASGRALEKLNLLIAKTNEA